MRLANMRLSAVCRALVLLTLMLAPLFCGAQDAARFEVASVKREPADAPILNRTAFGPAGFEAESASMSMIMAAAYGVGPDTLHGKGEPFSLIGRSIALYRISAKAAKPAPVEDLKVMLQNLLVERFQLRYHWEDRKVDVLALTVSKDGLKVRPNPPTDTRPGGVAVKAHEVMVANATLDALASTMRLHLGRPVANQTGESGRFTFTLQSDGDGDPVHPAFMAQAGEDNFAAALGAVGITLKHTTVSQPHLMVDSILGTPTEN